MLQVSVEGRDLLLTLDTGAASTHFNAKYVTEFPKQFGATHSSKSGIVGAGGMKFVNSYHLPRAEVRLGDALITLRDVPSLRESMETDQFDSVYGNAGQTLLNSFKTYTIDFRNMRFVVGEPMEAAVCRFGRPLGVPASRLSTPLHSPRVFPALRILNLVTHELSANPLRDYGRIARDPGTILQTFQA